MDTQPGNSAQRGSSKIHISAILVQSNTHRSLQSVQLSINNRRRNDSWELSGYNSFKATFAPPLDISISDNLELEVHTSLQMGSSSFLDSDKLFRIHAEQLLSTRTNGGGQQEWKKMFGKINVTILLSHNATSIGQEDLAVDSSNRPESATLVPTTMDILRVCPRFRILLIGKTGVGKSSLINKAFGVNDAHVADFAAGHAEIEKEIFSTVNPQFVLHDSRGFEPGEIDNFETVCDFIRSRNQKPDLKDKLHAIWVCMATPAAGSRILESGVEELLRLKNNGGLGDAPIIAVFTKFDHLVARENRKLDSPEYDDASYDEIIKLAKQNATNAFEKECAGPFRAGEWSQIPYKAVSTQDGYEATLDGLIQITFENVRRHIALEASVVTAIAQKPNSTVKIEGCIAVGKMRYWNGLASGINFLGKTLKACLDVIHTDIVKVWAFNDQDQNLTSKEFKSLMITLVSDDMQDKHAVDPNQGLVTSVATIGTIVAIVSALSGPAAPIAVPIAGGLVLAKWAYDVYQASRNNLEHIMAYIIDLTLVMQILFWIADGQHAISRRLIKLAFKAYSDSPVKGKVHNMVAAHAKYITLLSPGGPDATLEEIENIIHQCTINPEEMRRKMPPFDPGSQDEPWNSQ